jgi:hypothetical protein
LFKSWYIGCKKDATEYMLIKYLLLVIDENEEYYMILTAVSYMKHKTSRVCLSFNLYMTIYSCQLKIPMVNQLRVIDENEESYMILIAVYIGYIYIYAWI